MRTIARAAVLACKRRTSEEEARPSLVEEKTAWCEYGEEDVGLTVLTLWLELSCLASSANIICDNLFRRWVDRVTLGSRPPL